MGKGFYRAEVAAPRLSANAVEWVTAEGRWVRDREFGLHFKAEMLASAAPTAKEGIEKNLGSGMVKGIGPVYAKKLVEKSGERIFDIIEQESVRLEDVGGIGHQRSLSRAEAQHLDPATTWRIQLTCPKCPLRASGPSRNGQAVARRGSRLGCNCQMRQ